MIAAFVELAGDVVRAMLLIIVVLLAMAGVIAAYALCLHLVTQLP